MKSELFKIKIKTVNLVVRKAKVKFKILLTNLNQKDMFW